MDKIQKIYQDLYYLIWKSALISFAIALILISWTSARISTPLVQMNNIAKEFAKSNFDKRVKVNSKDEIGQLSNSFNSMAEELKKQNEMTKSFVANVSHELRSPLTSMQGFVQGMIDGVIPEDQHQQYLGIVLDETKRLNKLISELLNLAQIESGKFPLKIASFDVNELIRRVLIKYDVKLENKELEVDAVFRDEHCYVDADKDRIEQVISNLIDNAIKFTPAGGKLTAFTSSVNDKVTVSIKDSGPGIKEEDIAYIWDRFYKADKAHTVGVGGTGLGLSIVKKIIEQHDQKIWVESTYGKGTNFIFTLKKSAAKNTNIANKNL